MNLSKLKAKRNKRRASLKKHSAAYDRLKKSQKFRRAWQRRRIRADKKAIIKLNGLIKKAAAELHVDWNGCPPLGYPPIVDAARTALRVPGLFITATTNGTHSAGSWHYKSRAFDGGSDGSHGEDPEKNAQQKLLDTYGASHFAELFGPLPWYVKNGAIYSGVFPGHSDHLHVAVS